MNLITFSVLEIFNESKGKLYELYGMTIEEAQNKNDNTLFHEGIKQTCKCSDIGGEFVREYIFDLELQQNPYFVGYFGTY